MMGDLALAFSLNFFAELGDKTQLAVFALSTKYPNKLLVFLGSFFGLLLADVMAVLFGGIIAEFIPIYLLKMVSGVLFLIFGLYTILAKEEESEGTVKTNNSPLISSFMLVFLMEMGDKTQIINLVLATTYSPFVVLIGAITAMGLLTGVAVFLGDKIKSSLNEKIAKRLAGVLLVLLGIMMLIFG